MYEIYGVKIGFLSFKALLAFTFEWGRKIEG